MGADGLGALDFAVDTADMLLRNNQASYHHIVQCLFLLREPRHHHRNHQYNVFHTPTLPSQTLIANKGGVSRGTTSTFFIWWRVGDSSLRQRLLELVNLDLGVVMQLS